MFFKANHDPMAFRFILFHTQTDTHICWLFILPPLYFGRNSYLHMT